MTDCSNIDIREVLPEFLHGALDDAARDRVQAHLGTCPDCAAELRILLAVHISALSPHVDPIRVAAAIPPYQRRRAMYVAALRPLSSPLRLAAAALVIAAGVSTIAVTHYLGSNHGVASSPPAAMASPGIAIIGVSDLSDDHLEQLIASMDQLQATPPIDSDEVVPADMEGGV